MTGNRNRKHRNAGRSNAGRVKENLEQGGRKLEQTALKASQRVERDVKADRQELKQDAAERKAKRDSWHAEERSLDAGEKKLNVFVRILGALIVVAGLATLPFLIREILDVITQVSTDEVGREVKSLTFLLEMVQLGAQTLTALGLVVFGFLVLVGKRRYAMYWTYVLIPLVIAKMLLAMCLHGLDWHLILPFVQFVVLVVFSVTIDPALRRERRVQWQLKRMDEEALYDEQRAQGMAGRDPSGRGYITLNFFNIFWMFVAASIIGLILETIFHYIVFGVYQDRAGMLWGPFSPIYGFGAVLMTVCLNRLYKSSPFLIFCASAVIGGAFEYFTSWFMQTAFGITAWNYSNEWGNIDGRTSVLFMCMWGLLGLAWIKLCLPPFLKLIQMIPWKVRYWLTAICFVLILFDGIMTLMSLDAWYNRLAGISQDTPIAEFFARYFDNSFMSNRFQTMSLNPKSAGRM